MPPGGQCSISVVMPAHNEQDLLLRSVETVMTGLGKLTDDKLTDDWEILICENGSSDATPAIAAELADGSSRVRCHRLPEADYGVALREGFLAAGGELVANFDVDLVDFDFLDRALEVMEMAPATAVVVGTKRGPGADDQRGAGRRLVTAVYSVVLRRGFGLHVSDTHGLKLLRREALAPVVDACRFGGDIFDTELILRAERAGLGVRELPIRVSDQRPPRTSILARIPRSLVGLGRLRGALWSEARRRGHRPIL